jgi:hypothetical protein
VESIFKSLKKATTKFFANSDIVDLGQLDLAISVTDLTCANASAADDAKSITGARVASELLSEKRLHVELIINYENQNTHGVPPFLLRVVVSAASLNDLVGAQQKRLGES